jgi:hypothetical protein
MLHRRIIEISRLKYRSRMEELYVANWSDIATPQVVCFTYL